jgi:hypothetical protein
MSEFPEDPTDDTYGGLSIWTLAGFQSRLSIIKTILTTICRAPDPSTEKEPRRSLYAERRLDHRRSLDP